MEQNKIYLGNCLELIKKIKDESVDCIITDPPYCIGTTSNGCKGSVTDNNLIEPFFDILFKEYKRVLKNGKYVYINTDWRTYPFLYPIISKYLNVRNLIVWDYEWIKAGSFYRHSYELIIFATKGEAKRNFVPRKENRDVWRISPINFTNLKEKLHQAQKPIELVEKCLLNSTTEGDLVLDSFVGSGTTPVTCLKNNRNFIGFEIDKKYFDTASERIKEYQEIGLNSQRSFLNNF